jgi:hypothetical protein
MKEREFGNWAIEIFKISFVTENFNQELKQTKCSKQKKKT